MKQLYYSLLGLLFYAWSSPAFAQVISSTPPFPTEFDQIVITFNAAEGNRGLAGFTGDVYAHTGVITNLSTSNSDWRYVKTNWGVNTPATKLERIGTDLYQLTIGNPREYYGVPGSETISRLAFVFRSATQVSGAWREGKDTGGADIFQDIFEPSVNVAIIRPSGNFSFVQLNEEIEFMGIGTAPQIEELTLQLWIDGQMVNEVQNDTLTYTHTANSTGRKNVMLIGFDNASRRDTARYYYVVNPQNNTAARPSGVVDGINVTGATSVTLSLFAPQKEFIYVIGDFNNWEVNTDYLMNRWEVRQDSVHFWLEINNLDPNTEYAFQYFVDGHVLTGDPYSEKILDPWNDHWINVDFVRYPNLKPFPVGKTETPVTVFKINKEQYQWRVENFEKPDQDALVFYELLIRDFAQRSIYETLKDSIGYFKRLGVNAIKLMPVSEFDGNDSWGYNPAYHMALDKYYGTHNDFKAFIDLCHENGIAVVMDVVFNHATGLSPLTRLYWDSELSRPSATSIYANPVARHPFNVFYDLNHESSATNYWMKRVLRYWMEEFKIDGFRFDLSKGHTQRFTTDVGAWNQYDLWRVNHWRDNFDFLRSIDPKVYVVLEHLGGDDEERDLANYGMLMWGKMTDQFNEATMGWNLSGGASRFNRAFHVSRGFNRTGLVAYMESHDEERIMYKNRTFGNQAQASHNARDLAVAAKRTTAAAAFLFGIPGPKMMWMFGELGYDVSIFANQQGQLPPGTYGTDDRYRTGRKPIRWEYYEDPIRNNMYRAFGDIIKLRTTYPVFHAVDVNVQMFDTSPLRRLQLTHSSNTVNMVANFDLVQRNMRFDFPETGTWYEFFSGEELEVTDVAAEYTMQPAELRIYSKVKFDLEPGSDIITSNEWDLADSDRPARFEINKIYPNPFNPSTTIQYSVASNTTVVVDVMDILGRRVAVLQNGQQAPGVYNLMWDASRFASGVYMIRMQANGKNHIQKVTLVK